MPEQIESVDLLGIADGYSPAEYYDPSEVDAKTVANVTEIFESCHEHRLDYESIWELHRLYLKGEQLLFRNRDTGEIVRLSRRDQKRLFSINNQLRPTARSLVGKMTRMIPTYTTRPATNDTDEIHGARVNDSWMAYFRRKEELDLKYMEMCEYLTWAGTACIQSYWDPDAGRDLAWCERCNTTDDNVALEGEVCEQCAEQMQQEYMGEMAQQMQQQMAMGEQPEEPAPLEEADLPKYTLINEGDLKCKIIDIRDVFVEPGATDPENMRYVIVRNTVPVTEVRRRFPMMAAFIKAEDGIHAEKTARLSNSSELGDESIEYLDDHVQLYEYHEVPTLLYKNGRILFIANNMILEENTEPPYKLLGRLPFYFFWWLRNAGEFWGESFMAQAWHRQKELNENETQMREYIELLARPKVLAPIGSRIASDELSSTTGQVIHYNAQAGPLEWLRPPEMPQSAFARGESLKMDIRSQAGVTEQEAGGTPTDPNGRAMAIIEAETDQQMGPITLRNNKEWKSFYKGNVILAREHYDEERKFTVGGHDQATETYLFSDMNILPGWDLELEVDDGLSQNKAVRMNQAIELLNAGVFGSPELGTLDMDKFSKVAKLKVVERAPDLRSADHSAAIGMIKRVEAGEPVEPFPEDDPVIFADIAVGWLKQQGRKMQAENPELVQQIRVIYMFYQQWAAALMGGVGGMPGGGFGAPSPQGGGTSAPGGTPSQGGLGMPGGEGQGGVVPEAQQQVQAADQQAEGLARPQQEHES